MISEWIEPLLSNAIVATLLALAVGIIALARPRPAVMHALWLIVLLKFITPPLIRFELPEDIRTTHQPATRELAEPDLVSWIRDGDPDGQLVDETTTDLHFGSAILDADPSTRSFPHLDQFDGAPAKPYELATYATRERQFQVARRPLVVLVEAARELEKWLWARLPSWVPRVLVAIWAAGSAMWFLLAIARLARFRRHVGRTQPASHELQRIAADVAERLDIRARPVVHVTDANLPPMLTMFHRRGLVLLPNGLLRGLSESQQAAVIAHELAHLRRRDHWVRWLEFIVMGLYWWHAVAWIARRKLEQAEESCCDAWVLRVFPDQAKGYAQALVATVDFLSEVLAPAPAGACGFGRVHSLQRRLTMILKRTWRPELSSAARLMLIAVALAVLPWAPRAFSQTPPPRLAVKAERDAIADPPQSSPIEPLVDTAERDLSEVIVQLDPKSDPQRTTEQRLDRLEAMLNQLLGEMSSRRNEQYVREFREAAPLNKAGSAPPASGDQRGYLGRIETWQPQSAREAEIKAKLVDLEFEIKSLELQLQRAQAQREHLLQQLKNASSGGSSRSIPAIEDRYLPPPATEGLSTASPSRIDPNLDQTRRVYDARAWEESRMAEQLLQVREYFRRMRAEGKVEGDKVARAQRLLSELRNYQRFQKAPPESMITEVFLHMLGRRPTEEELATNRHNLEQAPSPHKFYDDLCWALVNSHEFWRPSPNPTTSVVNETARPGEIPNVRQTP